MADERLIPNRQTALTRYMNKYGGGSSAFSAGSFAPSTVAGIKSLDAQRANLGQNPFTNLETTLGARATDTGQAQVPEPNGNFFEDLARNVQQIVSEVPKMPVTIAREIYRLPESSTEIAGALAKSDNPAEQIGNLAQVPGLRLLPGSFIASQFGTGGKGVGGLVNDPLFTALDALPFASKAAKLTNTVRTAETLADQARPILARTGTPVRTPAIRTFVENWKPGGAVEGTAKLGNIEYPALQPNAVGRAIDNMTAKVKTSTPPGRWIDATFSREARTQALSFNRFNADTAAGQFLPDAPVNAELVAKAKQLTDDAAALGDEFADIPADIQAKITNAIEVGKPGAWDTLDSLHPQAKAYATRYKALNDDWGRSLAIADEGLSEIDIAGGREIYDTPTARRIEKTRRAAAEQAAVQNLRAHLDTTTDYRMTPEQILADARTAVADTSITVKQRGVLARSYIRALSNEGIDIAPLTRKQNLNAAGLAAMFDNVEIPTQRLPLGKWRFTEAAEKLKAQARTDPTVSDLVRSLKAGEYRRARNMAKLLEGRTKFTVDIDLPELRFELDRVIKSETAAQKLRDAGYSDTRASALARQSKLLEARSMPARFQPAVLDRLNTRVVDYLKSSFDDGPELDALLEKAAYRLYDDVDMVNAVPEMKAFKAEARRSWQTLRAEGFDPTFVHHVTPQRAMSLNFPKVMDFTPSLSQTKARLWDAGPQTTNLAMTLNARGMEYLIQQGSKAFVDDFAKTWGRTLDDLSKEFHAQAVRALDENPSINYPAHLRGLIEKQWAPFDPNSFMNPKTARIGANPETTLYAPRALVENLERLRPKPSELGKIVDPVMKVFRTSLLPLSPRWHVYNILGGAIMMLGRAENPVTIWKYMNEARRMVKEGGIDARLRAMDNLTVAETRAARTAVPAAGRQAGEFLRDVDMTSDAGKLRALTDNAAGQTLRRWWNSAETKKVMRDPFNRLIEKSYSFNEWFDDFYKSMAYLEGSDRALIKNMTREQQILKGVEASRQILQNWDTITPMERSAMRFLMPFYGWTRTLLRYTLTYPADHPWRMSILANLARAEMTDQQSGLPQRLRDLLFFGDVDAEGNQKAINVSGLNPFRDVASYFTLAGFLTSGEGDIGVLTSQLNPLISTTLQWAGVDPSSGSPELYPDMRYDPTTGQLIAAPRENPALGMLGNFLPQSRVLTQMTGMSQQFRELSARNPQAAGRMLASSAGLPVLQRTVNVPQEVTKAEAQRLKFLRTQLNDALKSGDRGGFVSAYPTLGTLYDTMATKLATEGTATPDPKIQGGGVGSAMTSIVEALKTVAPGL